MSALQAHCSTPQLKAQIAGAEGVGVTVPAVTHWCNGTRKVPANKCLAIEAATNGAVTRYQLRPDIYGVDPAGYLQLAKGG